MASYNSQINAKTIDDILTQRGINPRNASFEDYYHALHYALENRSKQIPIQA